MKEKSITLLRVSVVLNTKKYEEKIVELTGVESEKSYIVTKSTGSKSPHKRSNRISKESLMLPLSKILQSHRMIAYYAYCLPEDKDVTLEILKNKVIESAQTFKEECDSMFSNLKKIK